MVLRKIISSALILSVCVVLTVLSGCGKIQDIRPTSFKLESISPKGLSAAEMNFRIGIHNPVMQISLSDIFAEVVVSGKVIGNVSVSPFVLEAKSDKEYDIWVKYHLKTAERKDLLGYSNHILYIARKV